MRPLLGNHHNKLSIVDFENLYRRTLIIREFEERLLQSYRDGRIGGTTHTCLGQEALAVAALWPIAESDSVFSNHRSHGHFLAYGGDIQSLVLEILGHREGVCGGVGGSQHLHFKRFFSNGIQGGGVPIGAGTAFAAKIMGTGGIAVCFLGDGTFGEGTIYETFNLASLWQLPILFVVENNQYAQSTHISANMACPHLMGKRPESFGIETMEIESNDLLELVPVFEKAFDYVRTNNKPFCQIVHTYRLGPHSKGDDFRSEAEIASWRTKDPVTLGARHLPVERSTAIGQEAKVIVENAFDRADQIMREFPAQPILTDFAKLRSRSSLPGWVEGPPPLGVENVREGLGLAMSADSSIHLLGEDILDPYGGAFKVTKGLSEAFPGRVHTTPISEASIVGISTGMSMCGLKPVVEIMFGDFIALTVDQVLNHMTKFPAMYGNKVSCPVVVRTPMGGYRGYGPTHSQSIEKLFLGIPGLVTVAMSPVHDQRLIIRDVFSLNAPVFYIENKSLYGQRMISYENGRIGKFNAVSDYAVFPTLRLRLGNFSEHADATLIVYGGLVPMALTAAEKVFIEDELLVDVIVPSQISPMNCEFFASTIGESKSVIVVEEGTRTCGWGSEVIAALAEHLGPTGVQFSRVSALDSIVPNSIELESQVLPSSERIVEALRKTTK